MKTFKGFDKNMQCRGFQFEIGKTYRHEGNVEACNSGFHSCEYPLDIFAYYPPSDENQYAEVIAGGDIGTYDEDSKIASGEIQIVKLLSLSDLVAESVAATLSKITNTDNYSAATNTGYKSAATNTDNYSAATNTGDYSEATNTGNQSAATNTGDQSAATNTGYKSAATNTGYKSAATNTGDQSAATNTGNYSAATNTGNQSAATNTGDQSAATNTGHYSAATNTGHKSAATNTGDYSEATVSGNASIAVASGSRGKAKASKGSAIVLCAYDAEGNMTHCKSGLAGKGEIMADTFYTLDDSGKFVEVD